jgi:mannose-6-phosphate isomerase-like protein (cupin superfamily)
MHANSIIAFVAPPLMFACAAGTNPPPATPAPTPAAAMVATATTGTAGSAPEGFAVYTPSELKDLGKRLASKMNDQQSASEPLGKFGNHSTLIGHREGSGEAEFHENLADFFVVQEGEARLVVGGTIDNAATKSPGEIRGTAITGGYTRALKPGDIVHIPARMPHQLLLEPGAPFTYFVIKVESPKSDASKP